MMQIMSPAMARRESWNRSRNLQRAKQMEPLTLDTQASLGLTEYIGTKECKPPCVGWWQTRSITSPDLMQPQRRWWNGRHWSMPVIVGKTDDELTRNKRYEASFLEPNRIEWCGLLKPPAGGYLPENGYKKLPFHM